MVAACHSPAAVPDAARHLPSGAYHLANSVPNRPEGAVPNNDPCRGLSRADDCHHGHVPNADHRLVGVREYDHHGVVYCYSNDPLHHDRNRVADAAESLDLPDGYLFRVDDLACEADDRRLRRRCADGSLLLHRNGGDAPVPVIGLGD